MSGLEIASAALGIADFSFKSVSALYQLITDLRDAPEDIKRLKTELDTLQGSLIALQQLERDHDLEQLFSRFSIQDSAKTCEKACAELRPKLERWKGSDLLSKVRAVTNKTAIAKTTAAIVNARGNVTLTVTVASLAVATDPAVRQQLEVQITSAADEARQARLAIQVLLPNAGDPDDPTVELVERDLTAATESYDQYYQNTQRIQLNQEIGNIELLEDGKVWIGMPAESVHEVQKQKIGNIKAGKGSVLHAGIFGASR